jgi:hypothetical protein
MERTDLHFKNLFQNQILKDIKFYNTRETYLSFEPETQWVLQGGVEFIFENNTICLGWHTEMHLYEMIEGDLDELLGDLDVYEIDLDQHQEIMKLKNQKIQEVSFNWNWYQKMDDDMELTDEKVYIPQEIKLVFEDKSLLQIATVLFHLKGKELKEAIFDPQGNMLVCLNKTMEIRETWNESEDEN